MKAPYGRVEASISQGPFHPRDPSLGCWPRHSLADSPTCPPTVVKGTGSLNLGQNESGKEGRARRRETRSEAGGAYYD